MNDYLSQLGFSRGSLFTREKWPLVRRHLPIGHYVYCLWRTDTEHPTPFYIGKGRKGGELHARARAVYAGGVRYEYLSLAAKKLGVHPPAITRRIQAGWPGDFYEDEGQKPRTRVERYSPAYMKKLRDAIARKKSSDADQS